LSRRKKKISFHIERKKEKSWIRAPKGTAWFESGRGELIVGKRKKKERAADRGRGGGGKDRTLHHREGG